MPCQYMYIENFIVLIGLIWKEACNEQKKNYRERNQKFMNNDN